MKKAEKPQKDRNKKRLMRQMIGVLTGTIMMGFSISWLALCELKPVLLEECKSMADFKKSKNRGGYEI